MRKKIREGFATIAGLLSTYAGYSSGGLYYLHEKAHELAASLVYETTKFKTEIGSNINILEAGENSRTYLLNPNSEFHFNETGKFLGSKLSDAVYTAGGPIFDMSLAFGLYFAGHRLRHRPDVSRMLKASSFVPYALNVMRSAATNLGIESKIQDDVARFVGQTNLNPAIPLLFFALPLPLLHLYYYMKK